MRKHVLLVATGGGSGYAPFAPGTAGALVGLLLWLPLTRLSPAAYLLAVAALSGLGVWAAGRAEVLLGQPDDARITIDEVAGMLLALALLPARLDVGLVGFALFRLFDIWKPWPVRAAESLRGGLGVMADDLVAGLMANGLGQLLWRLALPEGLG
ncbi:MAG: phosphatidylglycerophosphatase A [Myxococcota bacterium]